MNAAAQPLWYGHSLREWRAAVREARYAYFAYLPAAHGRQGRLVQRHHALLIAATWLLPLEWHLQHAGRLSPAWRAIQAGRMAPPPSGRPWSARGRGRHRG